MNKIPKCKLITKIANKIIIYKFLKMKIIIKIWKLKKIIYNNLCQFKKKKFKKYKRIRRKKRKKRKRNLNNSQIKIEIKNKIIYRI